MGELGEALALMHGAADRFSTVRATLRDTSDAELAREAERRFAASPEGIEQGWDRMIDRRDSHCGWRSRDEILRLWVEKPDRIREERQGRRPDIAVRDGRRWWMYTEDDGLHSNEAEPEVQSSIGSDTEDLLDPSRLLGAFRFRLVGETTVAGRRALRLAAEARGEAMASAFAVHAPPGADGHDLAVDVETGVVLRRAALLDGKEFQVTEMLEVAFDERFAPDVFTIRLPSGEAPPQREEVKPQEMSLEQAAALASFAVLAVRLPDPWTQHTAWFPGDPRSGEPEAVHVVAWLDDASHRVRISQHAEHDPDPFDEHLDWETIERNGRTLEITQQEPPMESGARIVRDGTRATVRSGHLPLEEMVAFALSLAPVASV